MSTLVVFAIAAVVVVLLFDYTNGFHDAANVVATVVASNAMTPRQAVVIVSVFEFLGPVLSGTAVANTLGGIVHLGDIDAAQSLLVVVSGLVGAILWNILTWLKGIPSSSSHALVGALAGVVSFGFGPEHVVWGFSDLVRSGEFHGVAKVLLALLISPIVGFGCGFLLHRIVRRQLNRATPRANIWLRRSQYVTAAGLAFSHGANDGQKSMGVLTLVLLLGGFIDSFVVPKWVIFACASAITLGILSGGWRIVRTLGFAIFKVRPLHALDSQLTSALVVFGSSMLGAPVSTTHVVSTAIMGVGTAERPRSVHWDKAREIALTWVVTIPGSAIMAILVYVVLRALIRLTVS